jgi:hypothetical protein
VCHKVDKRLSELVKKKQRLRAQRAAALEKKLARDGGLRNSKGEFINVVMQPTLPKIMLDDEDVRETKSGMSKSRSQDTLGAYSSGGECFLWGLSVKANVQVLLEPMIYTADTHHRSITIRDCMPMKADIAVPRASSMLWGLWVSRIRQPPLLCPMPRPRSLPTPVLRNPLPPRARLGQTLK